MILLLTLILVPLAKLGMGLEGLSYYFARVERKNMTKDIPSDELFNQLNFDEKAWHVWHHATFMMVRQNKQYRVNLYHLKGYHIQLWYHVKRNRIDKIAATKSDRVIRPYLSLIEINDLLLQ